MNKAGLIVLVMALTAASSAYAGGRHNGHGNYGNGHSYGGHHRGYGYSYGGHHRGYGRHHYGGHHDYYGYLAAGLLVGGLAYTLNQPAVVRERVVYRRPIERAPVSAEPVSVYQPVPAEPPPYHYRKNADGSCWLIERAEDGSETITPQDAGVCG